MATRTRTNPNRRPALDAQPTGFAPLPMPAGGGGDTFSFDDPLTRQFEGQSRTRIGELDTPLPHMGSNPQLEEAMAALSKMMSSGGGGAAGNAGLPQFQAIADKRLAQLDQPGFSGTQRDILRTDFTDPLEGQRSAAKQQVIERLAKQGIQPSSGLAQQALMDVDRSFSEMRTTGERGIAIKGAEQDEARKQEAVSIGQLLASLYGQDAARLDAASGRDASTRLSAAGALGGLGGNQQQFDWQQQVYNDTRKNTALDVSQTLSQLPLQRLQAALAANSQLSAPTPQADSTQGLMGLLLQLANQGRTAGLDAAGQTGDMWSSLIKAIPGILGALPGGGTPSLPGQAYPKPTMPRFT